MASLVRVSEAASIAIHTCLWLASESDAYHRSGRICEVLRFSTAHFAKVMQTLARAGLVTSVRGPTGGTRLARPAHDITLLTIYEAVDGPARRTECLLAPEVCRSSCCALGSKLAEHNDALCRLLAATTLETLARNLREAGTPWPPDASPSDAGRRPARSRAVAPVKH